MLETPVPRISGVPYISTSPARGETFSVAGMGVANADVAVAFPFKAARSNALFGVASVTLSFGVTPVQVKG